MGQFDTGQWASMNEVELLRFDKFFKAHRDCRNEAKKYKGASLRISPTGIGTAFEAKCPHCKEKEDITTYDKW